MEGSGINCFSSRSLNFFEHSTSRFLVVTLRTQRKGRKIPGDWNLSGAKSRPGCKTQTSSTGAVQSAVLNVRTFLLDVVRSLICSIVLWRLTMLQHSSKPAFTLHSLCGCVWMMYIKSKMYKSGYIFFKITHLNCTAHDSFCRWTLNLLISEKLV